MTKESLEGILILEQLLAPLSSQGGVCDEDDEGWRTCSSKFVADPKLPGFMYLIWLGMLIQRSIAAFIASMVSNSLGHLKRRWMSMSRTPPLVHYPAIRSLSRSMVNNRLTPSPTACKTNCKTSPRASPPKKQAHAGYHNLASSIESPELLASPSDLLIEQETSPQFLTLKNIVSMKETKERRNALQGWQQEEAKLWTVKVSCIMEEKWMRSGAKRQFTTSAT